MSVWLAENAVAIAALGVAIISAMVSAMVSAGLFVRHKREIKDLIYVEQERDNFRKKLAVANVRLAQIDPERFIDNAAELYRGGEYGQVEALALAFAEKQSEAFGKAAEYLAE